MSRARSAGPRTEFPRGRQDLVGLPVHTRALREIRSSPAAAAKAVEQTRAASCPRRARRSGERATTTASGSPADTSAAATSLSRHERAGNRLESGGVPSLEGLHDDTKLPSSDGRLGDQTCCLVPSQRSLEPAHRLAKILGFELCTLDGAWQLVRRHRQHANGTGDRIAIVRKVARRPAAADERQPRTTAKALGVRERRSSRSRRCAARAFRHTPTGRSRGSRSSRSVPSRTGSLRSGSRAASSAETKRTETSRSSQTTRLASSTARSTSAGVTSRIRSIVDISAPMWKLVVRFSKQPIEGGRQHVLARVLLHVVEAAGPVDLAAHRRAQPHRRAHDV